MFLFSMRRLAKPASTVEFSSPPWAQDRPHDEGLALRFSPGRHPSAAQGGDDDDDDIFFYYLFGLFISTTSSADNDDDDNIGS